MQLVQRSVPRGRPRDTDREQAILECAVDMLGEVGYDLLTMDALASRVRASKATLYRRWAGKAELVCEALHRCKSQGIQVDTGTLRGDLLLAMEQIAEHMQGDDGALMAGVLLAARRDPDLAAAMKVQMTAGKEDLASDMVAQAVARGELPAGADPAVFVELIPGALFFRAFVTGQATDELFLIHLVDDVVLPLLLASAKRQPGQQV